MAIYAYGTRGYGDLDYKPFHQPEWYNLNPAQDEYYRSTPEAVFGSFNSGVNQAGYGRAFTDFADRWVRKLYGQYQGDVANNPEQSFIDYVRNRQQEMRGDYISSLGTRPIIRPTRIVR
jgi:hypothetical protein